MFGFPSIFFIDPLKKQFNESHFHIPQALIVITQHHLPW